MRIEFCARCSNNRSSCQIVKTSFNEYYCPTLNRHFPVEDCHTFENCLKQHINPKGPIGGILYADDLLLDFQYYQYGFTPHLKGPGAQTYSPEYKKLESWFGDRFFELMYTRIASTDDSITPDLYDNVKSDFSTFYKQINCSLFDNTEAGIKLQSDKHDLIRILIKKAIRKIEEEHIRGLLGPSPDDDDIDTRIINKATDATLTDDAAALFSPGSALFFLELYSKLKESDLLTGIQTFCNNLNPRTIRSEIGSPVVLLNPWKHQLKAYNHWKNSTMNGIIEMATATGKTLVGMMAIEELTQSSSDVTVRVIAHSRAILDQWRREVIDKLGLIGNKNESYEVPISAPGIKISFNTIQSILAYKSKNPHDFPSEYAADLLIFDEVHHYAASQFSQGFEIPSDRIIGLSATIGGRREAVLESQLPVVYTYSLKNARDEGIIPQFIWKVIPTNLEISEKEEFDKLSEQIVKKFVEIRNDRRKIEEITERTNISLKTLGDFIELVEDARLRNKNIPDNWKALQGLILKRRWIIHTSKPRMEHATRLIRELMHHHKVIVYTMDIASCEKIHKQLSSEKKEVYIVHSQIKDPYSVIKKFKECTSGVLIGARMLDEGIDIKDADIGVNIASSKTRLQLIQRMGRILRKAEGKIPVFYHYVAIPERSAYEKDQEKIQELDDSLQFYDDLSWAQDTASRLDIDLITITPDELLGQVTEFESSVVTLYRDTLRTTDKRKIGTFNVGNIIHQIRNYSRESGDQQILERDPILYILKALEELYPDKSATVSDQVWKKIVYDAVSQNSSSEETDENVNNFDIPGYWWLLVVAERNPEKLANLLDGNYKFSYRKPARGKINNLVRQGYQRMQGSNHFRCIESFEYALTLDPGTESAWKGKIFELKRLERINDGIEACQQALTFIPESRKLKMVLAELFVSAGEYEKSLEVIEECLEASPDDIPALFNKGCYLGIAGKNDEAIQSFKQIVNKNPGDYDALYNIGFYEAKSGNYSVALNHFKTLKIKGYQHPSLNQNIAYCEKSLSKNVK